MLHIAFNFSKNTVLKCVDNISSWIRRPKKIEIERGKEIKLT